MKRDLAVGFQITFLLAALAALTALTAGCSSYGSSRQAELATQRGDWDAAVVQYLKALETDPGNVAYKSALLRAKIKASQEHFEKAKQFRDAGAVERALVEFEQAVQLDPTNQYAKAELEHARQAYQAARQNRKLESIEAMKRRASGARPQPPELNPRSNQPISLEFPEPVSIFDIYRALGKAFGINILFDPNLKDQQIAIDLKNVNAQAALETLMRASGHFYKVMDEQTIIIAADTPQNRRTYEDLVIQTFFLSNSEVKDMMTILRSLVDSKKIAANEQLNAIILRDTADKVKVAERIIEANDKSKAEVVVDVELLQINTGKLRDLGASLSGYSVGQSLDTGVAAGETGTGTTSSTGTKIRVSDIPFLNQSNWVLTIPSILYSFVKNNSEAQLLAKPQLRITEGEKAFLVIGDKVPIPLTTFNTQNAVPGGGIIPITSFQYQDIGIRIDIEPRVHHNQEVTLKIKVEVSQITRTIPSPSGDQPVIGTRIIDSTIRLQDGETNFLAGLIRTDESNTDSGVPGLSEIPILGRLFSRKTTDAQRTDVILTMTPHIIRNAEITAEDLQPIWVGTEANISFRGASPRVESDVEGPFDGDEGTPEQIEDAIRRRIQRLPRGLRPGETPDESIDSEEDGEAPAEQQPPGIILVQPKGPSDIFAPPPVETPPQGGEQPPGLQQQSSLDDGSDDGSGTAATTAEPALAVARPGNRLTTRSATQLTTRLAQPTVALAASDQRTAHSAVEGRDPAVRLWLTPQTVVVAPGDRFEVRLEASALEAVSHLPLTLAFDPAALVVEKVEAGDFLGGDKESQVLSDFSKPGLLVLGASRLGQIPGVAGTGLLARITFRAVAPAATRIEFREEKALDASLRSLGAVKSWPAAVQVLGTDEQRPGPKPRLPPGPPREASPVKGG